MLRDLLRSHPRLTFPGESHFIPAVYRTYGDPRNESEARALAARILATSWVKTWGLTLDPSAFGGDRSYARMVSRVFEAWAEKDGKPRWGDKTPRYVLEIPLLVKLFPKAKILHIIRDGRDVAVSWLRAGFGPRNLFTAAHAWCSMVEAGRRASAGLDRERYLEVRYEALVAETAGTMREVCAFLEESFTEAVLRPSPFTLWHYDAPIIGKAPLRQSRPTEIVGGNAAKWKQTMTRSDRVLFESMAGDLLQALGYETEGRTRKITKAEKLMWRMHHRLRWMLRRLNQKDYYREVLQALGRRGAMVRQRLLKQISADKQN